MERLVGYTPIRSPKIRDEGAREKFETPKSQISHPSSGRTGERPKKQRGSEKRKQCIQFTLKSNWNSQSELPDFDIGTTTLVLKVTTGRNPDTMLQPANAVLKLKQELIPNKSAVVTAANVDS